MAFPVVQEAIESSTPTAGTSHIVTLPTATAGQLLLIILDKGSTAATINVHASLTELLDENLANGLYVAYRQMDGTEPASYTLTSSASTRSAHIAYRISGAENPATQAPVMATTGSGSSATPDPPVSATPPSTKDYLFIALYGAAGEEADDDTWSDTPPTNYTPSPPRQKACGVAGTNLGGMLAAAERQLNTGTAENPGTFAKDTSAAWRSQTITIYPVGTQTFPQTLTATAVASIATRQLQADKTVTASLATVTVIMTRSLTLGRTLTASVVSTVATLARVLVFDRTLTTSVVVVTASRQLETAKGLTASVISITATSIKDVAKALTVAPAIAAATMTRGLTLGRTLTTTAVAAAASMTRGATLVRTLTATVVPVTSTMTRQVALTLAANVVTITATIARELAKTLTALVSASATVLKEMPRTLSASVSTTAAFAPAAWLVSRTLTAVVTVAATISRGVAFGRVLSASVAVTAKLRRYRAYGISFLYIAANWITTARFYLEVFLRGVSGIAHARLYNETDGIAVTNSDLSTASQTFVRLRSPELALTDGRTYTVQFGLEGPDAGDFRGAQMIEVEV